MSRAASPPVGITIADGVARIVLDNPAGSNRLGLAAAAALEDALSHAADPSARCVTVTATGTRFCVGGDLTGFADTDSAAAELHHSALRTERALRALGDLPKPVVVGVHGAVAGAGLSFVLNADLVVAARSTQFVVAYTAVGLTPDCGVSYLLPRLIGQRRALELMLLNTRIDADRALDWGLVTEVVDDDDVTTRVDAMGQRLAAGPEFAFAQTKRLVRSSWDIDRVANAEDEARTISVALRTADAQQRIGAFLANTR